MSIEWPVAVKPTIDQRTTLSAANLTVDTTAYAARRDERPDPLEGHRHGVRPHAGTPVDLVWSTVVGNRVNCTGKCWNFVSVPLGG